MHRLDLRHREQHHRHRDHHHEVVHNIHPPPCGSRPGSTRALSPSIFGLDQKKPPRGTCPPFAGSRRFHRGRILDDLRDHECLALADLGQPELVERLAAEGLIEISSDGYVRLAL